MKDALHTIKIKKQTFLSNTYNIEECIEVNSFHKQSIKKLANNFIASAIAEDGTIEAIENGNIIAVQWHPEKIYKKTDDHLKLFKDFVDNCKK